MMNKTPMTPQGYEALQEELVRLKSVERPKVVNAIATARALGDLKENAEYHAAREQQSFIEGRIIDIESKLSNVQVIDVKKLSNQGKVVFGSTVKAVNIKTDEEIRYCILGEDEADIKVQKISYSSPLGRALIGKSVGEEIMVNTPGGVLEYEILEVMYS